VKVGDLVRLCCMGRSVDWNKSGVVVDIEKGGLDDQATIQVMWSFLGGEIRWECPQDIEVISESR
jgi:hypothetical protein